MLTKVAEACAFSCAAADENNAKLAIVATRMDFIRFPF
jgi:hypothetical protein